LVQTGEVVNSTFQISAVSFSVRVATLKKAELDSAFPFFPGSGEPIPSAGEISLFLLGNFAWRPFVAAGVRFVGACFVRDDVIYTDFIREGEIWGTAAFQHFALSPPPDQRGRCAQDDYQHDKGNKERQRASLVRRHGCR
jgi:hypothetical protein